MVGNFEHRTMVSGIFSQFFCCACAETARIPLPVKFSTQNLNPPWAVSYSTTNFGRAYYGIYACFEQKTAIVMQNFRNLGASEGGGDHF